MKKYLFALILLSTTSFALDHEPLSQDCNSQTSSCFASFNGLLRSMASGSNFHAHVAEPNSDFVLINPDLNPASLYLVTVSADGSHHLEYIEIGPRQERRFDAFLVNDAMEYYVMSLQRFKLLLPAKDGKPAAQLVHVPRTSLATMMTVAGPTGERLAVAIDAQKQVHHGIYGRIVGSWDSKKRELVQPDGSRFKAAQ